MEKIMKNKSDTVPYFECPGANQFIPVRNFYWNMIDQCESLPSFPGWQKGVYPSDEQLQEALKNQELYLYKTDKDILGSMVINQDCNEYYPDDIWSLDIQPEKIACIHILGTNPDFLHQGIARTMVEKAIDTARSRGWETIRLDVMDGNFPARNLYESCGFIYRGPTELYYEDTGRMIFHLYERIL